MERVTITQYTNYPYLSGVIYQGDQRKQTAVNLTGWTGKIYIKSESGLIIANGTDIEITDYSAGEWQYEWNSGDTDVSGRLKALLKFTNGEGKTLIAPSDGHFLIDVIPDVSGTPRLIETTVYLNTVYVDEEIL